MLRAPEGCLTIRGVFPSQGHKFRLPDAAGRRGTSSTRHQKKKKRDSQHMLNQIRGSFWRFVRKPFEAPYLRNENSAQRGSFWPDIPADIRPKTSVRPSKSWKTSILERTSCADIHEKTSVWKTSGWFSAPQYRPNSKFSWKPGLRVVFPTFRLSINSCVFDWVKLIETD